LEYDSRVGHLGHWLLYGDFNIIYRAKDKNNSRLNRQLMGRFHKFLQDLELVELHLHNHLYTWSNEQEHPTLERIDRTFVCVQWCDQFPHHHLDALSSSCFDHSPLLLHTNVTHIPHKTFTFESIWPKFPGYLDDVRFGWQQLVHHADLRKVLDAKFQNTTKSLKSWSRSLSEA
jgi:hypothetical protein